MVGAFALLALLLLLVAPVVAAPRVTLDTAATFTYPAPAGDGAVLIVPGTPGEYLGLNGDGVVLVRWAWGLAAEGLVKVEDVGDALLVPVDWQMLRALPECPVPLSPGSATTLTPAGPVWYGPDPGLSRR